jgi:hypothetical protein
MKEISCGQTIAPPIKDLIKIHFYPNGPLDLTATEIKEYIECMTGRKIPLSEFGKALKSLGFQCQTMTAGSVRRTLYSCGQH